MADLTLKSLSHFFLSFKGPLKAMFTYSKSVAEISQMNETVAEISATKLPFVNIT